MSSGDAPAPRVRAPLLIGLGVMLVAALAYVLLVLPGQDGVSDVDETQAVGPEPAPAPAPTGAPDGGEPSEVPSEEPGDGGDGPSFEVFGARDPFEQLVSDDTPDGVGDTQDTAAPDGTLAPPVTQPDDTGEGGVPGQGGAPAAPATPGDGAAPGDGTSPGSSGGRSDATVGTTTIRLEEVFADGGTDMVLVLVNSDGYEAAEGETVAGSLTVLDIEDSCATMRYDGRRFVLCEGEQVRK